MSQSSQLDRCPYAECRYDEGHGVIMERIDQRKRCDDVTTCITEKYNRVLPYYASVIKVKPSSKELLFFHQILPFLKFTLKPGPNVIELFTAIIYEFLY